MQNVAISAGEVIAAKTLHSGRSAGAGEIRAVM